MAIIPINVIMTSQEANSGPLYDVYYSIDGINYILSLTDANLPSVGSSVVVNVDEDYCRIRLVDASTSCEGTTNTINVGGCISTTTTTTTTTSTTSTSTTTTTTTAPPDCRINTTINVTETGWIRWTLCDGTVQDTFLTSLGTYTITQCIQYDSIRAAIPLAELADWDNVVWGSPCSITTTTTTFGPCIDYSCGDGTETFSTGSNLYGIYPSMSVCPSSNECGTFVYDAFDRPNRFNLYDNGGLVATSGWVGFADYSGPWGVDLNVSPNGSFTYDFSTTSGRYVEIEYGPADPTDPISDSAEWSLTCGTCPTTTTTSTTTVPPLSAIGVNGYMQPCIGGTIDDYMGASVTLSGPVIVDTEVVVNVNYVFPGNSCGFGESTQAIYLTIPSGSTTDNFDACLNGIYFSGGATICSACIASCDNPSVDLSTFSC
jgi:hypothetical protein